MLDLLWACSVAHPAARQPFPYPLRAAAPIAMFSPHFAAAEGLRLLEVPSAIEGVGARTAAAPLRVIRALANYSWRPELPLVVLSEACGGLLEAEDRDWIWGTFGVPVFEYLLDEHGRLIALECEAHDGLHMAQGRKLEGGKFSSEACACGVSGTRLLRLREGGRPDVIIEKQPSVRMWRNWQTRQI